MKRIGFLAGIYLLLLTLAVHAGSVTAILPPNGTSAGGTAVTIVGTGFTGVTSLSIGGVPATGVTVVNDSMIDCTTGAHVAGTVDVVVGTATGSGLYTYGALPVPGGATWTDLHGPGSRPWDSITASADGTKLAATVVSGDIWTSTDGGANWTDQSSSGSRNWAAITSSADGNRLAAAVYSGHVWTSTDGGVTWTDRSTSGARNWLAIASSADGSKLAAVEDGGDIWTSTDGGATWTDRSSAGSTHGWAPSIASSADGSKLVAAEQVPGDIWTSTNGGATWTDRSSAGTRSWTAICSSADGSKLAATSASDPSLNGDDIWTSTDGGATWTDRSSAGTRQWQSLTSSADGSKLTAIVAYGGDIWTSTDGGASWSDRASAGSRNWQVVTSSADGSKLAAITFGPGDIRISPTLAAPTVTQSTNNLLYNATTMIINGSGFSTTPGNNLVSFNNGAVGTVTAATATQLTVTFTAPRTDAGSLTVVVTNTSAGLSSGAPVQVATVIFPLVVTAILPPNGSSAGGTAVTIVGSGFTGATSVNIGGVLATGVTVVNDSMIDCTTGTHATGTVDVVVDTATGSGLYTYGAQPVPGGATWYPRVSAGQRYWDGISSSADGSKLAATSYYTFPVNQNGDDIWTSPDGGITWQDRTNSGMQHWYRIISSADGSKLAAVAGVPSSGGGDIWTSTNAGTTWTDRGHAGGWDGLASSADGNTLAAVWLGGDIWTSTDAGVTWTDRTNAGARPWLSIAASADGRKLEAVESDINYPGHVWTSADGGASWTQRTNAGAHYWSGITSSADGSKLAAVAYYPDDNSALEGGDIQTSVDGGATWTDQTSTAGREWVAIASSADGSILSAIEYDHNWTSTNGGAAWTAASTPFNFVWKGITISADGSKLAGVGVSGSSGYIWTSRAGPPAPTVTPATNNLLSSSPTITITGTGFDPMPPGNNTVIFNDGAVGIVTAATATQLTVSFTSPPTNLGSLTAIVINDTTSFPSDHPVQVATVQYPVTITAVLPPNGTSAGGTTVTLVGKGFTGTTSVSFGGVAATSFTVLNDFLIDCTTSAHATGVVSAVVSTAMSTGAGNYAYGARPVTGGANWTPRGIAGALAPRAICSSADGSKLAVVDQTGNQGHVYTSGDGGATWTMRPGAGARNWTSIACSADGQKLAAVEESPDITPRGDIWTSTDGGATWLDRTNAGTLGWVAITSSADGQKLAAAAYAGDIWTSTDGGATWADSYFGLTDWSGIASAADGSTIAAVTSIGLVYAPGVAKILISKDSGVSWSIITGLGVSPEWTSITCSADGRRLAAADEVGDTVHTGDYYGYVWTSGDGGTTWTSRTNSGLAARACLAMSADGLTIAKISYEGVSTSSDGGATWTNGFAGDDLGAITSNADGSKLAAAMFSQIFTSRPAPRVPTVNSITPANGALVGGTSVTINGTDLTGATNVTLGGVAATNLVLIDDYTITAVTPPHAAGFASVLVTTPGGTNSANGLFIYRKPIEFWRLLYFGQFPGTGLAADTADPDHDGLPNLFEFAFGFSPLVGGSILPSPQIVGGNFTVTFPQPNGVSGITYGAQWKSDLLSTNWTAIPDTGSSGNHTFSVPIGLNKQMFFRYVVTEQ